MDKGFPEILNSHHTTQKFHPYVVNKLKNADSQRLTHNATVAMLTKVPHGNNPDANQLISGQSETALPRRILLCHKKG